jgi:hypothetical protein
MFALMLLPCNDTCNSLQHETPTTVQAAQNHHQEDNDICSPFCFCSCCATAMTIHNFPTFGFTPHLTVQDFSMLELAFVSNAKASIWQPPKLS